MFLLFLIFREKKEQIFFFQSININIVFHSN